MKKILSTMLVGALIAGIAFAEVKFEYKGTAILGNATKFIGDETTAKDDTTTKAANKGAIKRTDQFALGVKNEVAGVEIEFDVEGDGNNAGYSKFNLDHFYGYLTFGLPVGNLQITSGKWDARWVERVINDRGELQSAYYEAFKPGVIGGSIATDIDNLTGNKNMSTVLAYTINDVLPGSLMFKFGLVGLQNKAYDGSTTVYNENSNEDTKKGNVDSTIIRAGFVGQIAYRMDDLFKINVDFKTLKQNAYAFGVFLSPLMLEKLTATVGFSMGIHNQGDKIAEANRMDKTEWGVDLRLRYAITEKLAITTMHNISGRKYTPNSKNTTDKEVDTMAMWNMISASLVAGDNIRFLATVQNKNTDWKASYYNAGAGTQVFSITPACEIKISDRSRFTAAFDIRWDGVTPYAGIGDIKLPIYFIFSL